MTIVLELPAPPSVNNLFLNLGKGKGRTRSPEYRAWQAEAGWLVQASRQSRIDGPVSVWLYVEENSRRDLDGYAKAALDLLVAHRLIQDDRNKYVRELHAKWSPSQQGIRVTVFPLSKQPVSAACVPIPNDAEGGGG